MYNAQAVTLFLSPCKDDKFSIETHMQDYEFMFVKFDLCLTTLHQCR